MGASIHGDAAVYGCVYSWGRCCLWVRLFMGMLLFMGALPGSRYRYCILKLYCYKEKNMITRLTFAAAKDPR